MVVTTDMTPADAKEPVPLNRKAGVEAAEQAERPDQARRRLRPQGSWSQASTFDTPHMLIRLRRKRLNEAWRQYRHRIASHGLRGENGVV